MYEITAHAARKLEKACKIFDNLIRPLNCGDVTSHHPRQYQTAIRTAAAAAGCKSPLLAYMIFGRTVSGRGRSWERPTEQHERSKAYMASKYQTLVQASFRILPDTDGGYVDVTAKLFD